MAALSPAPSRNLDPLLTWEICRTLPVEEPALPIDEAQALGIVSLGLRDGAALIAAADLFALPYRRLEARLRRPVIPAPASPREIALAHEFLSGRLQQAEYVEARLNNTCSVLGIPSPRLTGNQATATDFSAAEDWTLELLALGAGLPHVEEADPPFALRLLLPPASRYDVSLAPWRIVGHTLVLVCTSAPSQTTLDEIHRWTDLLPTPVLVPENAIAGVPNAFVRAPESNPIKVISGGLISLLPRSGESVPPAPARDPALDSAALCHIPFLLARSLQVVPLGIDGRALTVAVAPGLAGSTGLREALSAVAGIPVRLRQIPRQQLVSLLTTHSAAWPPYMGGRHPGSQYAAVPTLRLERYPGIAPEQAGLTVADLAALRVVPLGRDGNVLWLATDDLDDRLETVTARTRLAVRPVLVSTEALNRRLRLIPRRGFSAEQRDNPVIRYLLRKGQTDYETLADVLDGSPLDIALDRAGIMSAAEFSRVAADMAGLQIERLALREGSEAIVDAVGRRTTRTVWLDPVEAQAARRLDEVDARQFGILPIRSNGESLVVAVVDPFDPRTETLLASLGRRVERVVTTRDDISAAAHRVWGRMALGEQLLVEGIVGPAELEQALRLHRGSGVRLGQALLALGLVTHEQLAYFLAQQLDLPFYRLRGLSLDEEVGHLLPEDIARARGALPLYRTAGAIFVAMPDPTNGAALADVEARLGTPVHAVVCTEDDFDYCLDHLYANLYLERSTSELLVRAPDDSAVRVLNRTQQLALIALVALIVAASLALPGVVAVAAIALSTCFYLVSACYKGMLVFRALSHPLEVVISPEEVAELDDASLPVYTILVPLYQEAAVLPTLLDALQRMEYPHTKLDVILLLEEDDVDTRGAVDGMDLPVWVRPLVVPLSHPRNKPKACNYGLIHARGDYVVIYDAEDIPEPDQLKKVVAAFRRVPDDVVCLQAKLNYYNAVQNTLTRWFTCEYTLWFDLLLPGLDATRAPIPLGGTSNHFPVARLRDVGAWDPYNVTEDADLGLRLFRRGGRTMIVDSTTLEEANSEVYNWIRQRSRWVKGYVQTYLVHMRHPVRLARTLGAGAFFSFSMVVGGTVFSFLLNPLLWCLTVLWFAAHAGLVRYLYPGPVYYVAILGLVAGNFAFLYLNVGACLRREQYGLVRYALLTPIYWALMSLAAWKGFIQLWFAPSYWEKTVHGLHRRKSDR